MATASSTLAEFLFLLIDRLIFFRFAVSLYANMKVENSSSCSGKSQWPVEVVDVTKF